MRILASAPPVGAGTDCAESFLSILQRVAFAHSVRLQELVRFLKGVGRVDEVPYPKRKTLVVMAAGAGEQTRRLVGAYAELGCTPGVERHSLLALAGILSVRARADYSTTQRWCPSCLEMESEDRYGMLAWLFPGVNRCPRHNVLLESTCPECRREQSYWAMLSVDPRCKYCESPLGGHGRLAPPESNYAAWSERQILDLIAYLSDEDRPRPSNVWLGEHLHLFRLLGEEAAGKFKREDVFHVKALKSPPVHGFHLSTLLWLASNHSANLVDVILRPNEVLTGVFPNLEPVHKAASRPQQIANVRWPIYQKALFKLLEAQDRVYLPSQVVLSKLFRVSSIWFRDKGLAKTYTKARLRAGLTMGPHAGGCDRHFVFMTLGRVKRHAARNFDIDCILARREIDLPKHLMERIADAAKLIQPVFDELPKEQE